MMRRGNHTVIVHTADGRAYVWHGIDAGQMTDCRARVRKLTVSRITRLESHPA